MVRPSVSETTAAPTTTPWAESRLMRWRSASGREAGGAGAGPATRARPRPQGVAANRAGGAAAVRAASRARSERAPRWESLVVVIVTRTIRSGILESVARIVQRAMRFPTRAGGVLRLTHLRTRSYNIGLSSR